MSVMLGALFILTLLAFVATPRVARRVRRARRLRQRNLDRLAPGEIYVAADCCSGCGIPPRLAPELFEAGAVCQLKRQPETVTELRRALRVFREQDLSCIRYRGGHSRVRFVLDKVGCAVHADPLPPREEIRRSVRPPKRRPELDMPPGSEPAASGIQLTARATAQRGDNGAHEEDGEKLRAAP